MVLVHGVPVSSFLYRKVVPLLAARGLRGVAFDLPGLGLAERPRGFDYSWSGLAAWTGAAIDALEIERCHLVVHDVGGPVGFEWAIRNPDRVLSLTALNTLVDAASFHRPWPMHPFSYRGIGELWLRGMIAPAFAEVFYLEGVADRAAVPRAEVYAHHALLNRGDRGRAFLEIMRGFELTAAKERFFLDGLAGRPYPAQVVWGARDRMLGEKRRLAVQQRARSRVRDPAGGQALLPGGPAGPRSPTRWRRSPPEDYPGSPRSRAPFGTSSGQPRSGKGISITSKSLGATVAS